MLHADLYICAKLNSPLSESKVITEGEGMKLMIERLGLELLEKYGDFDNTVIIGLQPRGVVFSQKLTKYLSGILSKPVLHGELDITFHRDDFRRGTEVLLPNSTRIDFLVEGKNVVLVDDVLFTGRSVRAGLDALLAFGRPAEVKLLVLIDRKYGRDLPLQADYVGKEVDTVSGQKVKVEWSENGLNDRVILYTPKEIHE